MAYPVFESQASSDSSFYVSPGTSLVINKPTGTVAGDFLLAIVGASGEPTITATEEWEPCAPASAGVVTSLRFFWLVAGESEPADYTFTFSSSVKRIGTICRISGANPGLMNYDYVTHPELTLTTTAPSITAYFGESLVLRLAFTGAYAMPALPSGYTNINALSNSSFSIRWAYKQQASAGATGELEFVHESSTESAGGAFTLTITPTPVQPARVTIPTHLVANTGYNLSDSADFVTIEGGGVSFPYAPGVAILKNGTGGDATFTFLTPTPTIYAVRGLTIPDATVTVGDGDTWLYPLSSIFIQPDDNVYVDCSVEAQILVLP